MVLVVASSLLRKSAVLSFWPVASVAVRLMAAELASLGQRVRRL